MQIREEQGTVQISGVLGIADAEQLRDALAKMLAATSRFTVDLSGVEACDTSTIQLFLSLGTTGARSGKTVQVAECSRAVLDTASGLGLSLRDLRSLPERT